MVTRELRELIREAPRAGALAAADGPFGTGRAEHGVCGDVVEIDVRITDGRIADLRWRAEGCPATLACTAAAGSALIGVAIDASGPALRAVLAARGGLGAHEHHAERIVLEALAAAAKGVKSDPL